jgi:hypothetical protein
MFILFYKLIFNMACSCKSNSGVRKQVSQITKKVSNATSNNTEKKVNNTPERKQIVIRRPIH